MERFSRQLALRQLTNLDNPATVPNVQLTLPPAGDWSRLGKWQLGAAAGVSGMGPHHAEAGLSTIHIGGET